MENVVSKPLDFFTSEIRCSILYGIREITLSSIISNMNNSSHITAGNPALRQGKPGFGVGFGYGLHFNTNLGQIRVDYAMNAFNRKTIYFGINSSGGS